MLRITSQRFTFWSFRCFIHFRKSNTETITYKKIFTNLGENRNKVEQNRKFEAQSLVMHKQKPPRFFHPRKMAIFGFALIFPLIVHAKCDRIVHIKGSQIPNIHDELHAPRF